MKQHILDTKPYLTPPRYSIPSSSEEETGDQLVADVGDVLLLLSLILNMVTCSALP